jgi:spore germination protein YaaH
MDAVQELIDKYKVEPVWNEELAQYYVEIPLKSGKYRIWLEESRSLEEKLKLVRENHIAGIACWKLGLESSDVWPVIAEYIDE